MPMEVFTRMAEEHTYRLWTIADGSKFLFLRDGTQPVGAGGQGRC